MGVIKLSTQKRGGEMKVRGELPQSPEAHIEFAAQNGIGLHSLSIGESFYQENDMHSTKPGPEVEVMPMHCTPSAEELKVLLEACSKKSKENLGTTSVFKQFFSCKKGSFQRCLLNNCENEVEEVRNFCSNECIQQYTKYAVKKLKERKKKLKDTYPAVLLKRYTGKICFWNEIPSETSLEKFLTEHSDYEMCFPRNKKDLHKVKEMIKRVEVEGKDGIREQEELIPNTSEFVPKIQRRNSETSINSFELFGDGSLNQMSQECATSLAPCNQEMHSDDEMSSPWSSNKEATADAGHENKSADLGNGGFSISTTSESEDGAVVEELDQTQEVTDEDDTGSPVDASTKKASFDSTLFSPQTSFSNNSSLDSGYYSSSVDFESDGSSVDFESHGSSVDSKCYGSSVDSKSHDSSVDFESNGSSVDSKLQGSSVDSKVHDSSVDSKSQGSSVDAKSHGSSVDSKSHGSLVDAKSHGLSVNLLLPHSSTPKTAEPACNVDEEQILPEDRESGADLTSNQTEQEHTPNKSSSRSVQLKQINIEEETSGLKGDLPLRILDRTAPDDTEIFCRRETTKMIEIKEHVCAEIDHKTYNQMKENPMGKHSFSRDAKKFHRKVISRNSSLIEDEKLILQNTMKYSTSHGNQQDIPHVKVNVDKSQGIKYVKHNKCSKNKKFMIRDTKIDPNSLQKEQGKNDMTLLRMGQALRDKEGCQREKLIEDYNISLTKERNLIVEEKEDGRIYAHEITFCWYEIPDSKFVEFEKTSSRKSGRKKPRRHITRGCSVIAKRKSKRERAVKRGEKNLKSLTKKESPRANVNRIVKRPSHQVQCGGAISHLLSIINKFLSCGIIRGLAFLYLFVEVKGARPVTENDETYIIQWLMNLIQAYGNSQDIELRVPIAIGSGVFIWHVTRPNTSQAPDVTGILLGLGVVLRSPHEERTMQGPRLVPQPSSACPRNTNGAETSRQMTTRRRLDLVPSHSAQLVPSPTSSNHFPGEDHGSLAVGGASGSTPQTTGVSHTPQVPRTSGHGSPEDFPVSIQNIPDVDRVVDIYDKDRIVHRIRVSARERFNIYDKIGESLRSLGLINYILVDNNGEPVDTITPGINRIILHLIRLGNVTTY